MRRASAAVRCCAPTSPRARTMPHANGHELGAALDECPNDTWLAYTALLESSQPDARADAWLRLARIGGDAIRERGADVARDPRRAARAGRACRWRERAQCAARRAARAGALSAVVALDETLSAGDDAEARAAALAGRLAHAGAETAPALRSARGRALLAAGRAHEAAEIARGMLAQDARRSRGLGAAAPERARDRRLRRGRGGGAPPRRACTGSAFARSCSKKRRSCSSGSSSARTKPSCACSRRSAATRRASSRSRACTTCCSTAASYPALVALAGAAHRGDRRRRGALRAVLRTRARAARRRAQGTSAYRHWKTCSQASLHTPARSVCWSRPAPRSNAGTSRSRHCAGSPSAPVPLGAATRGAARRGRVPRTPYRRRPCCVRRVASARCRGHPRSSRARAPGRAVRTRRAVPQRSRCLSTRRTPRRRERPRPSSSCAQATYCAIGSGRRTKH